MEIFQVYVLIIISLCLLRVAWLNLTLLEQLVETKTSIDDNICSGERFTKGVEGNFD